RPFEFQRLHGMGAELYDEVIGKDHLNVPCRVYAPVGSHKDLLPYLVRRLLENGANTSFINHVVDEFLPMEQLVGDPCEKVRGFESKSHPRIPRPIHLYGELRKSSMGGNLASDNELAALAEAANQHPGPWQAAPLVPGTEPPGGDAVKVTNPADRRQEVGTWQGADENTVK